MRRYCEQLGAISSVQLVGSSVTDLPKSINFPNAPCSQRALSDRVDWPITWLNQGSAA
jgi:hypothetical protein